MIAFFRLLANAAAQLMDPLLVRGEGRESKSAFPALYTIKSLRVFRRLFVTALAAADAFHDHIACTHTRGKVINVHFCTKTKLLFSRFDACYMPTEVFRTRSRSLFI